MQITPYRRALARRPDLFLRRLMVALASLCLIACAEPKDGASYDHPLLTASEIGDLATVQKRLADGANADSKWPENDLTALYVAAQNGHVDIVNALLAADADVNQKSMQGYTALIKASQKGHLEVVRALIEAGAEVNAKGEWQGREGITPLITAALNGHREIVETLLTANAQVNLAMVDGATALTTATMAGEPQIMKLLLDAGADIDVQSTWQDLTGCTPLLLATVSANVEIVRMLLAAGANPDVITSSGETALTVAQAMGLTEVVTMIEQASVKK